VGKFKDHGLATVAEVEVAGAGVVTGGEDEVPLHRANMARRTTSTPNQPRPHQQGLQAGAVLVVGQEPLATEEGEVVVFPRKRSA